MRILITNDDGIHAPGLQSLTRIAQALSDDVWTVAPESEQSGASRSLTLAEPLRLRQASDRVFAIKGTPTDCVLMAVKKIMPEPPDLVLSGVNQGQNIAEDVTYSGTIAAAMEGTAIGIRSIALSQAYGFRDGLEINWDTAETHGAPLVRKLISVDWEPGTLVNVNFPDCAPDEVVATEVTEQGQRDQGLLKVDERTDSRGKDYFWIGFERRKSNPREGTDLRAVYDNRISVTPLHMNLTHGSSKDLLRSALAG